MRRMSWLFDRIAVYGWLWSLGFGFVTGFLTYSSSALQLFVSFDLLNYFFPFLPLLRCLFPIIHPPSSSSHSSHHPPILLLAFPSVLLHTVSMCIWSWPLFSLVILSTCPNQPSRLYFIYLAIFSLLIASSNSSFVLSLHSPFAFCVGPNILLRYLPFEYR